MFCANCGTKIEEGVKFCSGCGKAVSGVSNEPVVSVVQQQTAVIQPRPMADEMYCFSCGSVIKKEAEICPKCGVKQNAQSSAIAKERPLNGLAIFSIVLIFIGMIVYIATRFLGLSNESNNWGTIIGRINWWNIHDLSFFGGIILAFISLYKGKNKITFIAGIIAGAFYPLLTILQIIGLIDF
jgi:RNA polymerase subunit RPABC4/transcription elongation factor Spt4